MHFGLALHRIAPSGHKLASRSIHASQNADRIWEPGLEAALSKVPSVRWQLCHPLEPSFVHFLVMLASNVMARGLV